MTNTNTSATGGYLLPAAPAALPGNLTFQQFLQTIFVGISGLPSDLVRPSWQKYPPKQPNGDTNWLAIAQVRNKPDANAFLGVDTQGNNITIRHEELEIKCTFYGPDCDDNASLLRDGFQLSQNRDAMKTVGLNFKETTEAMRVPDLVNEVWIDRYELSVILRRQILRTYPILTFVSAHGTLETVVAGGPKTVAWNAKAEES